MRWSRLILVISLLICPIVARPEALTVQPPKRDIVDDAITAMSSEILAQESRSVTIPSTAAPTTTTMKTTTTTTASMSSSSAAPSTVAAIVPKTSKADVRISSRPVGVSESMITDIKVLPKDGKPIVDEKAKDATPAKPKIEELPTAMPLVQQVTKQMLMPKVNSRGPPREKLSRRNDEDIMVMQNNYHPGVAIPLTMDEYEKSMAGDTVNFKLQKTASSTTKDGISTWVLLSGSDDVPDLKGPEYQVEPEVTKATTTTKKPGKQRTNPGTKKSTTKPGPSVPASKLVTRVKQVQASENVKKEETTTATKRTSKRPTTSRIKKIRTTTPTTTTTTEVPTTTVATANDLLEGETTRPVELTTFLIMEPKDADFDLPQDRSPGSTTKKPKNAKKKKKNGGPAKAKIVPEAVKNATKTAVANLKNKNKPMTTQIYNYLAREVMPTVGVGLVGLVVTAGLATYFLGPFAPLRRSYEINDRKDEGFYNNGEDYNGQNEEEMFGKVIAGMPTAQLHRNNIRYQPYRRQAFAAPAPPPPKKPQAYPKYNPYLRYRTIERNDERPVYKNHAPAPAATAAPAPVEENTYNSQPVYNSVAYSTNMDSKAENTQLVADTPQDPNAPQAQALTQEARPYFNYHAYQFPQYQSKQLSESTNIVSEQTKVSEYNVAPQEQNSQFVVGSVLSGIVDVDASSSVPEHGPRRRRATEAAKNLLDNEIDDMPYDMHNGIMHFKAESTTTGGDSVVTESAATTETASASTVVTNMEIVENIVPTDKQPGLVPNLPPFTNHYVPAMSTENVTTPPSNGNNLFEFLRRMMELKLRVGLNFLQSATNNVQRYLMGVEKRIEESPYFSKDPNVRKTFFG